MKTFLKILLLFGLIFLVFGKTILSADSYNIPGTGPISDIQKISILDESNTDIQNSINRVSYSLLLKIKLVVQGLLVIFIVYAGIQMIVSMGSDEEKLSSSKRQIWYVLIAIIFINVPGSLFDALRPASHNEIGLKPNQEIFVNKPVNDGIFFNETSFSSLFNDNILLFFKALLFIGAVVMIIIAGIKIMTARGREDHIKDAKTKIIYSILVLIFAGIMEAWKYIAFDGNISAGINLFGALANYALFFTGPIAIFFLTFAGYYYITANGDEEKLKKAKSIVINTVLATIILLASYTFLLDLATLGNT